MTSAPLVERAPSRHRSVLALLPPAVAVVVVLLRFPAVTGWLGMDEAGYLAIGKQWNGHGTSLYGAYWVDRPPLLVAIYRVAALAGGGVPLRLLGILASVVAVLAVARALRALVGEGAAATGAVVTGALLVSPWTQSTAVNGELLAAPFVALAAAGATSALVSTVRREAQGWALLAGGAGAAAVLVKQNMVDGLLLTLALLLLAVPALGWHRVRPLLGWTGLGALVTTLATAVLTVLHGTSLVGVWDAMYPFRDAARQYLLDHPTDTSAGRAWHMVVSAAYAGLPLVLLALLAAAVPALLRAVRRAPGLLDAFTLAACVVVTWAIASIWLGGGWWLHYLVQLAVPLGLGAGAVTARWRRVGTPVAVLVAVSAVVGSLASTSGLIVEGHVPAGGNPVGRAIGRVSQPGDTIVTVWGHADVTWSSGLPSPYPYLWLLPARVLDPRSSQLGAVVDGPHAPTWFVVAGQGPHTPRDLADLIGPRYHRVRTYRDAVVYLRDGDVRPTP